MLIVSCDPDFMFWRCIIPSVACWGIRTDGLSIKYFHLSVSSFVSFFFLRFFICSPFFIYSCLPCLISLSEKFGAAMQAFLPFRPSTCLPSSTTSSRLPDHVRVSDYAVNNLWVPLTTIYTSFLIIVKCQYRYRIVPTHSFSVLAKSNTENMLNLFHKQSSRFI